MKADRLNQTLTLNDGRKLGFAEYGDLAGKPVFHFHGSAGSRLGRPVDETILTDLGIRLITTDRPGHGLSDPQPDRLLLDWPEDIRRLADHLDIDRFRVLGWSAGGPYALACACRLPERIIAAAIVSGVAPPDRPSPYRGLGIANRLLMFAIRRVPRLLVLFRRMGYALIMGDPDVVIRKFSSSLPPPDRQLFELPAIRNMFLMEIKEGYRQGWLGPAEDDMITNRRWGFHLQDISAKIDLWQGELDRNVPLSQAHYQHQQLPNSRLTVWPGQGHLYLLAQWREVLSALVA